jgi:ABC-type dipeptide/oligopeptide/nickel transport system permease component
LKLNKIIQNSWLFGLAVGVVFASLLTANFTISDWSDNPGGIFGDATGTNWMFVFDTAASWFVPAFLYAFVVAAGFHLLISRLMILASKKQLDENGSQDNEKS